MEQNIKSHREIHHSLRTSPGSRSGIWAAGIYLTTCGTLSIYSTLTLDGPDANLAGVIPYLVTAPWSLLPLGVLDPDSSTTLSNIIFVVLPVIGALINTVIIHTLAGKLGAAIHHHRLAIARGTHPAPTTPWSAVGRRTTVAR
jgi:hypothetical protein